MILYQYLLISYYIYIYTSHSICHISSLLLFHYISSFTIFLFTIFISSLTSPTPLIITSPHLSPHLSPTTSHQLSPPLSQVNDTQPMYDPCYRFENDYNHSELFQENHETSKNINTKRKIRNMMVR